jgi:type VI secretion system protein ImpI
MTLRLTIENHQSLPDGGPLSITAPPGRGIDIGRDQFLDWTLPDPSRYISGKHCEIRYQNGDFLLYDVSTNGTFLNGAQHRMQSPHRLRAGDRLLIGDYVITVAVEAGAAGGETPAASARGSSEYWGADGDIAPPIDPKELRPPSASKPIHSDFLEQAMGGADLYDLRRTPAQDPFAEPTPAAPSDFDWAPQAPKPQPVVEPAPLPPTPRRAPAVEAANPWDDDAPAFAAPPVAPPPRDDFAPPPAPREAPFIAEPAPPAPPPAPFSVEPAPPIPPAPPAFAPVSSLSDSDLAAAFIARFAAGAGVPAANLSNQDALALAQQAGEILRAVVVDMMQLLGARNEAKRMARSANQTVIQALDNNPLKFSPTPEDALRIMLGPQTKSYLDARRALAQGFSDLKTHQVKTYSAMQAAMRMIARELDPETIEKGLPASGGLAEMIGSRKARLWEAYLARWRASTERHDDGLVDVFMLNFADCYDRGSDGKE